MFVCRKCHRAKIISAERYPVTCCGVRHSWPDGWVGSGKPKKQAKLKEELRTNCKHLGAGIRLEECPTCCGSTRIKVFGCQLHGECTLTKKIGAAALCANCKDFVPRPVYSLSDITLVATSFLRFDHLRRLLQSVRYFYPGLKIIVSDQSGPRAAGDDYEFCRGFPNVTWLAQPYDCGLSAARNAALLEVKSPLVFLCDDDEIFMADSRLESLLDVLNVDQSIQVVTGLIRQAGRGHHGDVAGSWLGELTQDGDILHAGPLQSKWSQTPRGTWYRRTDRYINVLLARTETLRAYPWSESHKISGEHLDHVMRLKADKVPVVYTPNFVVGEIKKNSDEYTKLRQRGREANAHAAWGILTKTGNWRFQAEPGISKRSSAVPVATLPNIVLLTVGHTGSTVVAGLFAVMGWKLPDNDPEYNEPRKIRTSNANYLRTGSPIDAAQLLRDLPSPWLLKDPRFCETLECWLPAFSKSKPLLIWLDRDESLVRASYESRDEPIGMLERRLILAKQAFEYWPWAKQRIRYEDLAVWAGGWRR